MAEEIRRGKLPGATPEDAETAGGMVALAMGKMGAGELNYSSDIDLICLFDETRYEPGRARRRAPPSSGSRARMAALLSDLTAEGYVFRTDLRLRPDAGGDAGLLSHGGGGALLRKRRAHLGTRRLYQGAPLRRRLAAGERFSDDADALSSGAGISILRRSRMPMTCGLRIREHKGLQGRSCWKATT